MTIDIARAGQPLTAVEARKLTDRIRGSLTLAYEAYVEAFTRRADLALGYRDWDTYCASEFADERMVRIPREQRREIVERLRQAGMSTRAIGSAIGADHSTVVRDLAASGADAPDERVQSLDGRERPATRPQSPRLTVTRP